MLVPLTITRRTAATSTNARMIFAAIGLVFRRATGTPSSAESGWIKSSHSVITISLLIFEAGYGTPLSFFGLMTLVGLGNGLCIPNATAGMLSVRPRLAGTASGLGGAIMIGGGAGLSALVGVLLTPETGAFPLLWMMLITAVLGLCSITLVIRREKALMRQS